MSKTIILIPTRGRPEQCENLSFILTGLNAPHVFCVDDNDPKLGKYYKTGVPMIVGPPNRLGPWLNIASDAYKEMYPIIGFIGDDVIPRTGDFVEQIEKAMVPDGIVYCNDGWQGEGLPTAVFMDSNLIKRLGYMVYPELVHLYIDNHWKALGEHLGTLKYLPNVYLEHMHPFAGKGKDDAVYRAANSPDRYAEDGQAYYKFVDEVLPNI